MDCSLGHLCSATGQTETGPGGLLWDLDDSESEDVSESEELPLERKEEDVE